MAESIYERLKAIDADTHGDGWEDAQWEIVHYEVLPPLLRLIEASRHWLALSGYPQRNSLRARSELALEEAVRALTDPSDAI